VGTGKIKLRGQFRFDGGQPTDIDWHHHLLFEGLISKKI
jgi:hypothetical protein